MTIANPNVELLCPHCVAPIKPADDFCGACGGPITSHASIDPLGQIYAAGYAYRQAISDRPHGIVVLGMWLIFAPQALGAVVVFARTLGAYGRVPFLNDADTPLLRLIAGAVALGLLAVYVVLLAKVTARYQAARQTPDIEQPDDTDADSRNPGLE